MIILDGIIYSLQKHGGISVYFNEHIQRMTDMDADDWRALMYLDSASQLQLKSLRFKNHPLRWFERYRRCSVPEQVSLFHSSYYRLPDRRVPVVTTVHDFIYERFATGPRKWVHTWQKFNAIRASHAVICISESTRLDLLHFLPDIPPERLHVVHNGVSDEFYPLEPEALFTGAVQPYVLFVGTRSGYKNFAPLVHALADLRDLDLVCIGGGELTQEESTLINRQLGARFKHHMGVTDSQLNQFYNGAFCLAYPSAYEGFGIPVLEAMRAGCPVVAMNSSSIPEVAGSAAQLLLEASPEALKMALSRLYQKDEREHFRKLGFQQASLFSWDRTFAQTCKVYEAARSEFHQN